MFLLLLLLLFLCFVFPLFRMSFYRLTGQHRKVENGGLVQINIADISVVVQNLDVVVHILTVQYFYALLCSAMEQILRYPLFRTYIVFSNRWEYWVTFFKCIYCLLLLLFFFIFFIFLTRVKTRSRCGNCMPPEKISWLFSFFNTGWII